MQQSVWRRSIQVSALCVGLLMGCNTDGTDRAPPPPRVAPSIDPQLHDLVILAKADLRKRLRLPPTRDVQVISAQVVSWPNGAIGCPRPGRSYTQSIVTGARVEFRHAGASYYYHGRGLQTLALCEFGARAPLPKLPQPGNVRPKRR